MSISFPRSPCGSCDNRSVGFPVQFLPNPATAADAAVNWSNRYPQDGAGLALQTWPAVMLVCGCILQRYRRRGVLKLFGFHFADMPLHATMLIPHVCLSTSWQGLGHEHRHQDHQNKLFVAQSRCQPGADVHYCRHSTPYP